MKIANATEDMYEGLGHALTIERHDAANGFYFLLKMLPYQLGFLVTRRELEEAHACNVMDHVESRMRAACRELRSTLYPVKWARSDGYDCLLVAIDQISRAWSRLRDLESDTILGLILRHDPEFRSAAIELMVFKFKVGGRALDYAGVL